MTALIVVGIEVVSGMQIVEQEFSDLDNRSPSELLRSMDSLRLLQGHVHTILHSIVMNFLRTPVSSMTWLVQVVKMGPVILVHTNFA